jgi:Major Facilitator Superfamily
MSVEQSTNTGRPAPTGLGAYRKLLRLPGARALAFASLLVRVPSGMVGVGLILFLHERTGSFAAAGLASGAYVVGLGATGPLLARVIDRRGSRPVLLGGGLLSAASLLLVFALGEAGAGTGALAAAALLAGASTPPFGSVARRRWATVVTASLLPTAYAIEAVVLEAMFVLGPAVAGLLAATAGAGVALIVAAAAGVIGTVWFSTLVRFPPREATAGKPHWAGAFRLPFVRFLVVTGLPMGAGIAGIELALPAFGAAHGNAALGGPLSATLALGSLIGGVLYGARSSAFGEPRRALLTLATLQGLSALPMLLVAAKAEMFVAAAVSGLAWAPLGTVRSQLIQARVGAADVIEAFTWDGLSETVGASVSMAAAGSLVGAQGWRAGVVIAIAVPLLGALVAFLGRAAMTSGPTSVTPTTQPAG